MAVHHVHQTGHYTGRQRAAGDHGQLPEGHVLQHGVHHPGKVIGAPFAAKLL